MNARYKHDDPSHLEFGRSADSKLLAKKRPRGYAGGGLVQLTEGDEEQQPLYLKTGKGTPFVDAEKYPGWPQMAPLTAKGVTEA
jgi:hypothetical protein